MSSFPSKFLFLRGLFYRPQGRICHSKDRCPVRAMGVILKSSTPGASLWDGCYVFISHPTSRCSFELTTPALFWHGCHIVHVVIDRSATIRLNVPLNPPCGSQLFKGSEKGACGLWFLWSFPTIKLLSDSFKTFELSGGVQSWVSPCLPGTEAGLWRFHVARTGYKSKRENSRRTNRLLFRMCFIS